MRARNLFAAMLIVCVAACFVFAAKWRAAERRADDIVRWTRSVMDSVGSEEAAMRPPVQPWGRDTLYWQWVATSAEMQSRRLKAAVRHWVSSRQTLLDEGDIAIFRRQGLTDPVAQLRGDLQAHPELIPNKAVLGGTMSFNDVILLRPPFVFAEFEDGHIGGAMLLEYEVLEKGRMSWKLLWSRLD